MSVGVAKDQRRGVVRLLRPESWGGQCQPLLRKSVPEVPPNWVENHKGHSHRYFKQHICW